MRRLVPSLLLYLLLSLGLRAAPVVVGVAGFEPCVVQEAEGWSGFEVDVFKQVQARLGLEAEFRGMGFSQLLDAVAAGEVDVAIAGITITKERETRVDFSLPTVEAGYLIATRPPEDMGIFAILRNLLTMKAVWQGLLLFTCFLVLTGAMLWWSERGSDAIHDEFAIGIWDGIWLAFATATTVGYGDVAPKNKVGKLIAVMVCLGGAIVFSIAVGAISAATTIDHLEGAISEPAHLAGKRVATAAGTTSVAKCEALRAVVVECSKIEDAYLRLLTDEVEAVVFDSPSVMNFVKRHKDKVAIGGKPFDTQFYGYAFPQGSALRERVNQALLELREDGTYQQLYARWFGTH